jgi:hypothetical protein
MKVFSHILGIGRAGDGVRQRLGRALPLILGMCT